MTTAVDCHCDDADDGNDHNSADECVSPPASFTTTEPMQLSIPPTLTSAEGHPQYCLLQHLLYAQSELDDFYSDSGRQMLFIHVLYSLRRLSY